MVKSVSWFEDVFSRFFGRGSGPAFHTERVSEHPQPQDIQTNKIYVVSSNGHEKWAYLRCPCPKHDVIRLCLISSQTPSWSISESKSGLPSIYPSIWQWEGCYSHFWIQRGRVHWAYGSGEPPKKYLKSRESGHDWYIK